MDFYTFISDGAALIDKSGGKFADEIDNLIDIDKGRDSESSDIPFDSAGEFSYGDGASADTRIGHNTYNWAWGNFRVRISQDSTRG